jgi:hypothetical protein
MDMTKDEKAAYWRPRVDGFLTSGLSVNNYCAQEGIDVGTLHYWQQLLLVMEYAKASKYRLFRGLAGS